MKTFEEYLQEAAKKKQRMVDGDTNTLAQYAASTNVYKKLEAKDLAGRIETAIAGMTDAKKMMAAAKKVLASVDIKADSISIKDVSTGGKEPVWSFLVTKY